MRFEILDSTLRDGSQGEGISFSVQDKVNIVKILDVLGVDYIEAGNPASNPKDALLFEELKTVKLAYSKLCAFGSTVMKTKTPQTDAYLQRLLSCGAPVISIFGKAWDLHVKTVLEISLEENLKLIEDSIGYLKENGKEVIFDAEHFFDGYRENPQYACKVIDTALLAGADNVCLCDTNGGTLPMEMEKILRAVFEKYPNVDFGVHFHDDSGCAVANAVAAVQCGAKQVQGTLIGIGERCGNADLSTIVPNLVLKCGHTCGVDLEHLYPCVRTVAEISNARVPKNAPYIGKSAFAHKGGMHIDGVLKLPRTFEHVKPEAVGNSRKMLVSEVAGRGSVLHRMQQYFPEMTKQSPEVQQITQVLKEKELEGYQYEGASASFDLLVQKELGLWKPHFRLVMYKVTDDFPAPDGEQQANAIVKVEVDGKTQLMCGEGNGPVHAMDVALRRALNVFYPSVANMRLVDYKVRIIDSKDTAAKTRVLVESTDGTETYSTIGVSTDIIVASVDAIVDSFEYVLSKNKQ